MERFAIFEGYHAQVLAKFFDVEPMPDPAILLLLREDRISDGLLAPFQSDVWPLLKNPVLEVFSLLHAGNILHPKMNGS